MGRPDLHTFLHLTEPCILSLDLVAVGINNELKSRCPTGLVLCYPQVALEKPFLFSKRVF
jgi:hypothetical protein